MGSLHCLCMASVYSGCLSYKFALEFSIQLLKYSIKVLLHYGKYVRKERINGEAIFCSASFEFRTLVPLYLTINTKTTCYSYPKDVVFVNNNAPLMYPLL